MPQKTGQMTYILPHLKPVIFAALVFCVWAILCQKGISDAAGVLRTKKNLAAGTALIKAFVKEYHDVPESMVELKAYAAIAHSTFLAFDAYGNPLDYLPLSDQQYLLRSFGSDGRQNTLASEADITVGVWSELPRYGAQYRYQRDLAAPHAYPSPLALGSYAANGAYYAQIYHDQRLGTRKLVIRSQKSQVVQVAPHDFVEEYLWLADSTQLIFTATSSARYQDGVYLWNLETGETTNLLDNQEKAFGISESKDAKFFLSLAGASYSSNEALVFIKVQESSILDPTVFFQSTNLYRIKVTGKGINDADISSAKELGGANVLKNLAPLQNLIAETARNKSFAAFAKLSFTGPIEAVISGWQLFTSDHGTSILIPYCLWLLSSIYDDAYQLVEATDQQGAETLRSYGTELANALAEMPAAPSYLRAFGRFNNKYLLEGKPLPYKLSSLQLK